MTGRGASLAILITSSNMAQPGIKAAADAINLLPNAAKAATSGLGGLVDGLGKVGLAAMGLGAIKDSAMGLAKTLGVGLNSELEQVRASLNAFTKDGAKSEEILADIRVEAAKTPFAFAEMARATASLMPVAKSSGVALMDLVKQAEILAASNPLEGLEGASFSLREAMTGDFTSIIERFNLSRSTINKLKEEGVSNMEIIGRAMQEMGFDSDLIAAKAETLDGRWSTFMDTIDTLRATISLPIFNAMKEGLVSLQGLLDENMPAIEGWANSIAGGFESVIQGGKNLLPAIKEGIEPFVAAFVGALPTIKEFGGEVLAALQTVGRIVMDVFRGDLPGAFEEFDNLVLGTGATLVDRLAGWGQAFLDWIGPMLPGLLEQLRGLAVKLLNWFVDSRLEMVERLAGWAKAFLEWVGPLIPPFLVEMGKLGAQLLAWIQAKAPEVLARLSTWKDNFLAWIEPMIPPFLAEAGKIASALLGWIQQNGPILLQQFITDWVPAAINWLLDAAINIAPKLLGFLSTVLDWIIAEGPGILRTFVGEWVPAFIGWLVEAGVKVLPKLLEFHRTVTTWIATEGVPKLVTAAIELGKGLVQGLWQGLTTMDTWIKGQINSWLQGLIASGKAALGVHSPSKETMTWWGIPMGEGAIAGLMAMRAPMEKAVSEVLSGAVQAGSKSLSSWGGLAQIAKDALAEMGGGAATEGGTASKATGSWGGLVQIIRDLGVATTDTAEKDMPLFLHQVEDLFHATEQQNAALAETVIAAGTDMPAALDTARTAAEALAGDKETGLKFATDMATQLTFVMLQLRDAMPSIIRAIQRYIDKLNDIPSEVTTVITTVHRDVYETVGSPVGSNASGTDFWRGGLTWVGEMGKELVNLPRGTRVYSHGESMAMAGGGGGGSVGGGGGQTILQVDGITLGTLAQAYGSQRVALEVL